MTESFAELFESSLANQRIRPGMILTGLIVDVTDDVVIVNVGLKSEAVIPLEQFKNERGEVEVKPGDEPSAHAPGRAWKLHSTTRRSSSVSSRAASKAASQ